MFALTADSPCIDAGDPTTPLDPDATTSDLGALYYVPSSAVSGRPAINDDYELLACCPNPFNAETSLQLNLPASGYGRIAVYDITGKQVAVIAEGLFNSGGQRWKFNGADLASGIYLVNFESANRITTVKAVLLK